MNKKSIAILLVASSFASSAFANSIVNKLIAKHSTMVPSISKTHSYKQTNDSYIDFTGTWVGNCGDDDNITTVMENRADYIIIDGDMSRIGKGLQGKYQSDEAVANYEHTSYEWSKDGSALIMKYVYVSKYNVDNSAIVSALSTFSFTMKNGQMIFDGKAIEFKDLTQTPQPITIHCVFNKKQ